MRLYSAIAMLAMMFPGAEVEGLAQCYADGVMDKVVHNRIEYGQLPYGTDPRTCIAVTDCSWMGKKVVVLWPDGREMFGTVCDCSADEDRQRHIDKGLAVEVSWWAANEYAHPVGKYLLPRDGPLDGVTLKVLEGLGSMIWN